MRPRHPELGNTIPVPHECSDLCYFLHATILSALCFFSPHSPAVSVRTQAAHWLPLALLGGEKNNAEENRRLTKNITNQNNVQLFLTTHDVRA